MELMIRCVREETLRIFFRLVFYVSSRLLDLPRFKEDHQMTMGRPRKKCSVLPEEVNDCDEGGIWC